MDKILWADEQKHGRDVGATIVHRQLAVSSSGEVFALIGPGARRKGSAISIVDARSGELRSTIKPTGLVSDLAFSRDGTCLAVSILDPKEGVVGTRGKVEFWDVRTAQRISTMSDGGGPLLIVMSPQRDVMATISSVSDQRTPSTLKLWSLSARPAKSDFSRFQASAPDCLCAAFSPSGAMLAVGHLNPARRVTVYAVETGAVRFTLDHDEGQSIANVAFADEDHLIVTVHRLASEKAPTVLLWKLPQSDEPSSGSQK